MKPYFTIMISWSDREPCELGLYLTSDSRLNIYEVWFTESTHVCKKEHRINLYAGMQTTTRPYQLSQSTESEQYHRGYQNRLRNEVRINLDDMHRFHMYENPATT